MEKKETSNEVGQKVMSMDPILDAVKRNDVEFIKEAIESGVLKKKNVNKTFTERAGLHGREKIKTTLLSHATSLEMVKCLVGVGADVNKEYEKTVVHATEGIKVVQCSRLTWCAVEELGRMGNQEEKAEIFKFLIDSGAKIDSRALFKLLLGVDKYYDLVDYVLKSDARDERDFETGDKAIIRYAVDRGVGIMPNVPNSLKIIELLLKNGVPVEPKYVDHIIDVLTDNVRVTTVETKQFKKGYKRLVREHAREELKAKIMVKFKALADKLKSLGKKDADKEEKEAE